MAKVVNSGKCPRQTNYKLAYKVLKNWKKRANNHIFAILF